MPTYKILVGAYAKEISTLIFDSDANTLKLVSAVPSGQSPSWIAHHPTDKSLIFATNEVSDGKVQLFKLSEDGSLKFLEEVSSGGRDPASLAVTELSRGSEVVVANYSGSSLLTIPLSNTPPYLGEPKSPPLVFEGRGPNASRQEKSHPHQVIIHPTREEVIIPDLGADKVWRLKREGEKWVIAGAITIKPGGGPRHGVIYDNILYTALELSSTITTHTFPPLPVEPTYISEVSSLPVFGTLNPDMLLAEILVAPPSPGTPTPLIYVSNRNEALPAGDSISIYAPHHPSVAQKGAAAADTSDFHLLGSYATGLQHLRAIAIGGSESQYLVGGGALGGGVKVFERQGSTLKELAQLDFEKPTSFIWV